VGGAGAGGSHGMAGAGAGGTGPGIGGQPGGSGGGPPHVPDCSSFPSASSFVTPTDGLPHCYWVHPDPVDWDTSQSTCVNEGGYLATVLSRPENNFVLGLLMQAGIFPEGNPNGNGPPSSAGVWLGATDGKGLYDGEGPGDYAWVTGEPWGYTNWHMGQPDGSCDTCGGPGVRCVCDHWLAMVFDGTWFDRPDVAGRAFVCESTAR
jgi:hypothetical protein